MAYSGLYLHYKLTLASWAQGCDAYIRAGTVLTRIITIAKNSPHDDGLSSRNSVFQALSCKVHPKRFNIQIGN